MLTTAIGSMLTALIKNLPQDLVKEALDKLLDFIERKIQASENKIDDAIALPLITALRAQLGITEEEGSKYADENPDAAK